MGYGFWVVEKSAPKAPPKRRPNLPRISPELPHGNANMTRVASCQLVVGMGMTKLEIRMTNEAASPNKQCAGAFGFERTGRGGGWGDAGELVEVRGHNESLRISRRAARLV